MVGIAMNAEIKLMIATTTGTTTSDICATSTFDVKNIRNKLSIIATKIIPLVVNA